jgi:glycosyltransferase involved in cell wall biosynthesis
LYRFVLRGAHFCIVTNHRLTLRAARFGATTVILPDPLPRLHVESEASICAGHILAISTWAEDEPLADIVAAAGDLPEGFMLTLTGRPRGSVVEQAKAASKVRLSGFVSKQEYVNLLASAQVVVDLTTREDCLVCGGYEALSLGRPLVLSDSLALRELFRGAALYCQNSARAISQTILQACVEQAQLSERSRERKEQYEIEWDEARRKMLQAVGF